MTKQHSKWSFDGEEREEVPDSDLAFLKQYTKIDDSSELQRRLRTLHDEASRSLHVYRCVAKSAFINPKVRAFSSYIHAPRTGRVFEIGACFGTEVRAFLMDGFAPENITASDVTDGYWKLGQGLYGDAPALVRTIFTDTACPEADINGDISTTYGTFDLVVAMAVFHVLNQDQVCNMVHRIARLCRPGGHFVGYCAGAHQAGPWDKVKDGNENDTKTANDRYLHSVESLSALFREAGFSKVKISEDDSRLFSSQDQQKMTDSVGRAQCRLMVEATR